jgi:hypothetical protein
MNATVHAQVMRIPLEILQTPFQAHGAPCYGRGPQMNAPCAGDVDQFGTLHRPLLRCTAPARRTKTPTTDERTACAGDVIQGLKYFTLVTFYLRSTAPVRHLLPVKTPVPTQSKTSCLLRKALPELHPADSRFSQQSQRNGRALACVAVSAYMTASRGCVLWSHVSAVKGADIGCSRRRHFTKSPSSAAVYCGTSSIGDTHLSYLARNTFLVSSCAVKG